ncbi:MAG: DUF4332 domain-containing protein [Promethearchaeota archaeon]
MVLHNLSEFESIGLDYAQILRKSMKIRTVDDFLKYTHQQIHEQGNIDLERVEQWANLIDLFRVPNLSARECELLYNSNINSVKELSHRQSLRIFYKLREIDTETRFIVLSFPSFAQIDEWIYFAKIMSKRIKFGLNIPMILFPMVTIDIASEMKKFSIFTAEDLLEKKERIKKLGKKLHMKSSIFNQLQDMIAIVHVPGIDIFFAKLLQQAEYGTLKMLLRTESSTIFEAVEQIQSNLTDIPEKLTLEHINTIKSHLEAND